MVVTKSNGASPLRPAPDSGLHARLLDDLGTAICRGELAEGSLLYIDDLVDEHGVSRSVVREAIRVLSSMGMVKSRRRLGTVILGQGEWNVYNPQVIRWRLASDGRSAQLRSITELRAAVEPQAALLAAERATNDEAGRLVGLAGKMWAAGKKGDEAEFLRLDIEFHRVVLQQSGNEMFVQLHELVAEVLTGRHQYGLMPHHPDDEALQLHADVAHAIQRRDGGTARRAMHRIMGQALDEMSAMLSHVEERTGLPQA